MPMTMPMMMALVVSPDVLLCNAEACSSEKPCCMNSLERGTQMVDDLHARCCALRGGSAGWTPCRNHRGDTGTTCGPFCKFRFSEKREIKGTINRRKSVFILSKIDKEKRSKKMVERSERANRANEERKRSETTKRGNEERKRSEITKRNNEAKQRSEGTKRGNEARERREKTKRERESKAKQRSERAKWEKKMRKAVIKLNWKSKTRKRLQKTSQEPIEKKEYKKSENRKYQNDEKKVENVLFSTFFLFSDFLYSFFSTGSWLVF